MIKRLARWILRKEIEQQLELSVPVGTAMMIEDEFIGLLTKDGILPPFPQTSLEDLVGITGISKEILLGTEPGIRES